MLTRSNLIAIALEEQIHCANLVIGTEEFGVILSRLEGAVFIANIACVDCVFSILYEGDGSKLVLICD